MGAALKVNQRESEDDIELEPRASRRKHPRAIAYLCIDVCSEHRFWTGLTMNISEGGVFVATHETLEPGTPVALHLELPKNKRVMALGEVRWSRPYTGDNEVPPGLGIKFVGLDVESLQTIRQFILTIRDPRHFE